MPSVEDLIYQYSRVYGVDPRAARAVAMGEGGLRWGAVGDQGTSFGPFQLHVGGALPKGRNAAWANSPAGLAYAIRSMARAGARGLTGPSAIEAIVRNFERPADPNRSIQLALSRYGGGGGTPSMNAPGPLSSPGAAVPPVQPPPLASLQSRPTVAINPRNLALLGQAAERDPRQQTLGLLGTLLSRSQAPPPAVHSSRVSRLASGPMPPQVDPRAGVAAGGGGPPGPGGIRELFYDPLGAYDEGNWISPIGGHSDHVHVSFGDPRTAIWAIRQAQALGLRASENPYAEGSAAEPGVHTKTSYHYQTFPGQYQGGRSPVLGRGLDVSGSPELMARYFRMLKRRVR